MLIGTTLMEMLVTNNGDDEGGNMVMTIRRCETMAAIM